MRINTRDMFDLSTLNSLRGLHESSAMRAIRAMEGSPAIRMLRQFNDSPAIEAMRQLKNSPAMQLIRDFEESPGMRILRDLKDSPALKELRELEGSSALKAIQQLQETPVLSAFRVLEHGPAMEAFSKVAERISTSYGALIFAEAYKFTSDEYGELPAVDTDGSLNSLAEKVRSRASQAPPGRLSAEYYLNLVFAILLFSLSQMSASGSEKRMLERMGRLEATIAAQLQMLQEPEHNQSFLVGDRSLNLRSGPGTENDVLEILPSNRKVIEIQRQADWVKIEYFDHIKNERKSGWVHSRYLIIISQGN